MRGAHLLAAVSVLVALAASPDARAQRLNETSPPPMLETLDSSAGDPQAEDLRNQALAMLGREDRIRTEAPPPCILADADPLDMIAAAARDTNIVIINEAHDAPRHRAFIADVAKRLEPLGYRTYAAETLYQPTESGPGAPRLRAGWYSAEPTFGALLRQVREANFRLVAYDQLTPTSGDYVDDINRREAAQASNIVNRIFLQNRDEKVLIHVGWAHNKEGFESAGGGVMKSRQILWMAQRIKDILGVDPLTIDQTSYAADRVGACFTDAAGAAPPMSRDLFIAYPAATYERNRPAWRRARGQVFADIPRAFRRANERVIVEARLKDDPPDAVPADRILIEPGESIPLLLEPGRYRTRAWIGGKWTPDVAMTVSAPPRAAPPRTAPHKSRRKRS